MIDEIVRAVGNEPIHAVIVTGDVTYRARPEEFARVVENLKDLLQLLQLGADRLLLIPGNHDADWGLPMEERFTAYREAYRRLRGVDADESCHDEIVVSLPGHERIRFVGMNSCLIESKEHAGIGAVGDELLSDFLATSSAEGPFTTTVLCLHHHLLPVSYEDLEYEHMKRSSVTLDAKAVLEIAQRAGVELILHGHQHQPNFAVYGSLNPVHPTEGPGSLMWVVGAGSAGAIEADLGQANKRHFQVLTFTDVGSHVQCSVQPYTSHNINNQEFATTGPPISIHLGTALPAGIPPHLKVEETVLRAIRGAGRRTTADRSDLFVLLLKTRYCAQVNQWLREVRAEDLRVEGVYDLYGDFDLLVKIRAKTRGPIDLHIIEPLRKERWVSERWGKIIDIYRERYPLPGITVPIDEASHCIKAFMHFPFIDNGDDVGETCAELVSQFGSRTVMSGAYIGYGGSELMVEYLVACGAYYELSSIVTAIEQYIETRKGEKVTLLAQRVWEEPMLRAKRVGTSEGSA